MSKLPGRRRADALRSAAAVRAAAVRVLGERPSASVDEVAAAAGVTRQTIYAHFPSREALVLAAVEEVTAEIVAALDAADLDRGPAAEAVVRLLDTAWAGFERHARLLLTAPVGGSDDLHEPAFERVERLVRRGQEAGEFDREPPAGWLVVALAALAHAAGEEVAAGRLSAAAAATELRRSALRVLGAA